MSITICTGRSVEGYDPNSSSNSTEAVAAHIAACHETTFTGAVLGLRERNGYDDSDFYALVWDEEQQRTREIQYATTRGWTYHNGASIDATHDVIAKAVAHETEIRFADAQQRHAETVRKGYTARATVEGGATVEGVIAWIGTAREYSKWAARYADPVKRYGIRVEGRKGLVFVNADAKGFAFDAEPVSAEDMIEWRASCEHSARAHFAQAQAIADKRDPQPEPSSIVDSSDADAEGWMLYAVGEAFAEHSMGVAQHVVDESAEYTVTGVRASGDVMEARERTAFQVLHTVARYAEADGARILHDGHGAVRIERADGAYMVLRPVRPAAEEPGTPEEAVSAPQTAVESVERPEEPQAGYRDAAGCVWRFAGYNGQFPTYVETHVTHDVPVHERVPVDELADVLGPLVPLAPGEVVPLGG
ncbi:hypothetical protein OG497_37850 [Streptomyces sp. NBC_01242]|uniref:hypothetical protein n=1 Tax=Streptomyces sp. NBC_01242 TaxID=2903795 RepID=UPI00225A851A|nr:hypothetical protein [Streptomyces sp. NBC_01242]MCX4799623.1 hypothetical protein [Streptomyces sp. NBC_01242]